MEEGLAHGTDRSHIDRGTFTCQTCSVAFYTPDLQRTHYRSDWHRYNLKRRVANLTSVSATTFAEKVLAQKSLAATTADRANFAEKCEPCSKVYYSENAYTNHLGSKKHRDTVKAALEKTTRNAAEIASDDDDSTHDSTFSLEDSVEPSQASIYESSTASPAPETEDPATELGEVQLPTEESLPEEEEVRQKLAKAVKLPLGECLFCRAVQTGGDDVELLSANITHMVKMHSLFLPEQEYLTDLRGLIEYLQMKVSVGNFCLACNKGFRNLEACRAHMASTSHRRIAYSSQEDQDELADYYDFSSSYDDVPDSEAWEDSSDVDDDASIVDGDASDSDETIDSIVAQPAAVADDFELRLPSGVVVGHRSLARYYRQNLHGRDPFSANSGSAVHKAIMDRTQAARQELVANSIAGVDKGRKQWSRKHIATFTDMKRREDFKTRVGYRANNMKYYRPELLQ